MATIGLEPKSIETSEDDSEPILEKENERGLEEHNYTQNQYQEMDPDTYADEVIQLEVEEDRCYVFIFGLPGAGKTYMIASLMQFMQCTNLGKLALDEDKSTPSERRFYAKVLSMCQNNGTNRLGGTPVGGFQKLNLLFEVNGINPLKITFLDIPGEDCRQVHENLPRYLTQYLDARIRCIFLLLHDPQQRSNSKQTEALTLFHNKLLTYQESNIQYSKILVISKWDTVDVSYKKAGGTEEFVRNTIPGFANNFLSERNAANFIIGYSVGKFIDVENNSPTLREFNLKASEKLFSIIYKHFTGKDILPKKPLIERIIEWLFGKR